MIFYNMISLDDNILKKKILQFNRLYNKNRNGKHLTYIEKEKISTDIAYH